MKLKSFLFITDNFNFKILMQQRLQNLGVAKVDENAKMKKNPTMNQTKKPVAMLLRKRKAAKKLKKIKIVDGGELQKTR